MTPACTLQRNAQVWPNSAGVPNRFAGMFAIERAAASASLTDARLAARLKFPRRRAVSKLPGNRLLMVTFLSATLRETPAMKAVRPALAPLDKSRPVIGILTLSDVMLTIRPKPREAMESITF